MMYRKLSAADAGQVEALWDYCFEKQDDPFFQYYFGSYCFAHNTVIGGVEVVPAADGSDGVHTKLRTMLHLNPYTVRIRGMEQQVPYIIGVATSPEARGRHLLAPLLRNTFDMLREQGVTFVSLMPIFAGIYLPYEFSFCYYRHEYKLPLEKLTLGRQGSELQVEHMMLDAAVLAPLYARLTKRYNGVSIRDAFQWSKLLTVHAQEHAQCAVVYREGAAAGYMLYNIADGCLTILELLADSFAAKNRLLQYAKMHQSSATELHWLAEPDDMTYLSFADQSVTGKLAPFMMARCLDARRALAQLPVPWDVPTGEVVVQLTDHVIAGNNHLLRLRTCAGELEILEITGLTAEKNATADSSAALTGSTQNNHVLQPDVIIDMGAFTQLYMGTFSATELQAAGRVECSNPAKLALLDKLFPKCKNYINEYF